MTDGAYALPPGYEDLEPLAQKWARPTENARNAIRLNATAADFAAFYDALSPRLNDLIAALQDCPVVPETIAQQNMLMLVTAFAEAAPHHELYGGSAAVPHSFDARRFVPDHGDIPL